METRTQRRAGEGARLACFASPLMISSRPSARPLTSAWGTEGRGGRASGRTEASPNIGGLRGAACSADRDKTDRPTDD